ncbi:hypothetical protein Q6284_27555, partial [Klebsiella pneumoniae]|nr:hypothetical protein [Klebsiella pneumoniae]
VAITRHPEPRGLMWFDRGYHTLMRPYSSSGRALAR